MSRRSLMRTTLDGLVPLYMLRMSVRGLPTDEQIEECADLITAHGDDLEHSRGGGAPAEALNAIARAVAALALSRTEGVSLLGGHWCRDHRACRGAA